LTTALAVEESPDNVHSATAEALGLMGPEAKEAVPVLRKRLRHPSSYVRALAAKSLWVLAEHPDAVGVLRTELNDYRPEARIAAAEGLWLARQDPRAIAMLVEVLREHIDVGIPPTHENLEALANHRYMAARALGRIGPPAKDALPALRDLLHDEDADLRDTIADAVKKIESEKK
jgi:HEAT repeat protein